MIGVGWSCGLLVGDDGFDKKLVRIRGGGGVIEKLKIEIVVEKIFILVLYIFLCSCYIIIIFNKIIFWVFFIIWFFFLMRILFIIEFWEFVLGDSCEYLRL